MDPLFPLLLKEGSVFFCKHPSFGTAIKHPHVIFKVTDKHAYLVCCTRQYQTIRNYIKLKKFPTETMVGLGDYTFLSDHTFINCNQMDDRRKNELCEHYEGGYIDYMGEISARDLDLIIRGIVESPEIPKVIQNLLR